MWVRGAAIRPVPPYAVVSRPVLDAIEEELADNGASTRSDLDDAFGRFEKTQPALAQEAAQTLARPLDETALALGYFLTIAVWLAFERAFGHRLVEVDDAALEAAHAALNLEEELRATHADEPLDLEDVMAMEQPAVLAFVHEHLDAALDPIEYEEGAGKPREIDVDDVHLVYRNVLVMTLALSHAVAPSAGAKAPELLA